jgi:hypothetical protein
MNILTYQYVLADAIGLEQLAMAEIRERIRNSNPSLAAANAVLMRWFGDIMDVDEAMQTLLITAYLLSSTSVLGNGLCTAVEYIDEQFNGAKLNVSPGNLTIVTDFIELEVKVAIYPWPTAYPPQIIEHPGSDQPYLYAFIMVSMLQPTRSLNTSNINVSSRITEIHEDSIDTEDDY